jgi:ATP-dependent Lhr-like helicase
MNIAPEIISFFEKRNWKPADFQKEVWTHVENREHGLLNAPTGSGKTYALFLAFMQSWLSNPDKQALKGIKLIWITPIKALSEEILLSMQRFLSEYHIELKVQIKTGDTSISNKQKIQKGECDILIITPESLHLLFSQKGSTALFKNLQMIVVDEWHELLGSKRGVQTELAINYLFHLSECLIWGISATIGNLEVAVEVLLGDLFYTHPNTIVKAKTSKKIRIQSLLPKSKEKFPWAGHLGLRMLPEVIKIIQQSESTLLFTNTRAQAEIWYRQIITDYPEYAGIAALHHASLSKEIRQWVEESLHQGKLKIVVCTSALDLGVDFRPVDTVIQVGSPKGVNRCLQRAGRSGHAPGKESVLHFVPTHALELLEASALREAIQLHYIEEKEPMILCYDAAVQFLLTLACGDGAKPEFVFKVLKNTYCFRDLSRSEWNDILVFCTTGGESLSAYPQYHKAVWEEHVLKIVSKKILLQHRLSIGTIPNSRNYSVRFLRGGYLGSIEEWFISGLNIGDCFWFAGQCLEFIKTDGLNVLVKKATRQDKSKIPAWMGGRMPFSSYLSQMLRQSFQMLADKRWHHPELKYLEYIKERQEEISILPRQHTFLMEVLYDKEGTHLFFYPFEGRLVHEGLASLFAYRLSKHKTYTFSLAFNDYGFELLTDKRIETQEIDIYQLADSGNLLTDFSGSMNMNEMARKKFRDIAQISGLLFNGYPGKPIKNKHLQVNAQLMFDVFMDYEKDHFLLRQAFREVLSDQLEEQRIRKTLDRIKHQAVIKKIISQPSPLCFPILVDRLREHSSNETLEERIAKMITSYQHVS